MSKIRALIRFVSLAASLFGCLIVYSAEVRKFEDLLGVRGIAAIQIGRVEPGMPAEAAGLRTTDIIVTFNGEGMRAFTHYRSFLEAMRQAAFRGGATLNILRYDSRSNQYVERQISLHLDTEPIDGDRLYLGLAVEPVYYVTGITDGSAAQRLGLTPGDFIGEVNGQDFNSPGDLDRIVSMAADSAGRQISLWVARWRPIENGKVRAENTRRLTGAL